MTRAVPVAHELLEVEHHVAAADRTDGAQAVTAHGEIGEGCEPYRRGHVRTAAVKRLFRRHRLVRDCSGSNGLVLDLFDGERLSAQSREFVL